MLPDALRSDQFPHQLVQKVGNLVMQKNVLFFLKQFGTFTL